MAEFSKIFQTPMRHNADIMSKNKCPRSPLKARRMHEKKKDDYLCAFAETRKCHKLQLVRHQALETARNDVEATPNR